MDVITVKPAHEYENLFNSEEIDQFLQIGHQESSGREEVMDLIIDKSDNSVWIDYDRKISLKTNLYITLKNIILTIFNIQQDVQIEITKISIGEENMQFEQNFISKSLQEIREEYNILIIEFRIL